MFNISKNVTELCIGKNKTVLNFLEDHRRVNNTFTEKVGGFLHQFIRN